MVRSTTGGPQLRVHRRGRDGGVGRVVERAEVDRAGGEQVLRQRLPAEAAALRGLLRLVVLVLVVVLVVVVVAAPQQAVADLAEPLGDLVHGRRGDDEQAEEGEQRQEDDGDDGADPGGQRRADGPADQPTGAVLAVLRVGAGCRGSGRCRAPRRCCRASRSPAGRGPPGAGRCAGDGGPRRTARPAGPSPSSRRPSGRRRRGPRPPGRCCGSRRRRRARSTAPGRRDRRRRGDARARAVRPRRGLATERARPPAPRASRFQPPATIPKRPCEFFFLRAAGRRLPDRFAGGRFRDAVEPERPREAAGRRVDVVRAGMGRP